VLDRSGNDIVLAHDSTLPVLETVVDIEETNFVARKLVEHWSVQISPFVDSSIVHVAIARVIDGLGSNEHLLPAVVHEHRPKLFPFRFYKETKMVEAIF
jgi:hypothetical protein